MTTGLLERTPLWEYRSKRHLTQWYGHVELHGAYAIGQWFCVELATGRVLWDRRQPRANTIRAVDAENGVILAPEMCSGGPWTASFGIYAISLETGDELWTKSRGRGCLALLLDLIPGLSSGRGDTPYAIVDGECFTSNGRVLDVRTGEQLRVVLQDDIPVKFDDEEDDPANQLYTNNRLQLPDGDTLTVSGDRDHFALQRTGNHTWSLALAEHDGYVEGNFYSWRLHGSRVFLAAADAPVYLPVDAQSMRNNKCRYELWELDVETGSILAKTPLTKRLGSECRIEAVDDRHVLVSHGRTLWCYEI